MSEEVSSGLYTVYLKDLSEIQQGKINELETKLAEVEKERDELKSGHRWFNGEVNRIEKERDILKEACEFYADENNWDWDNNDIPEDHELIDFTETCHGIIKCEKGKGEFQDYIGGKKARQALTEIKGK